MSLAHVVQDDPDNPEMPGTFDPIIVVFEPVIKKKNTDIKDLTCTR